MFTMEIRVPSCGLASQPPSARPRDVTLRLKIIFWVARVCGSTKLCGTTYRRGSKLPDRRHVASVDACMILRLKTM